MANKDFEINLLRMIAAESYFSLGMTAAHEMYGKSYFSLGVLEKQAVDQAVLAGVGANYQAMTPENLKDAIMETKMGFQSSPKEPPPTEDKK